MFGVAAALVAVVLVLLAVFWYRTSTRSADRPVTELANRKETIHLWYTDDALTDYLSSKTLDFYNNTDIRVDVKLVSGVEYLEAVNAASLWKKHIWQDLRQSCLRVRPSMMTSYFIRRRAMQCYTMENMWRVRCILRQVHCSITRLTCNRSQMRQTVQGQTRHRRAGRIQMRVRVRR